MSSRERIVCNSEIMTKVIQISQFTNWMCKRYFKFIFLGAMSTCLFFNIALHTGTGLYMYCQEECFDLSVRRPLSPLDMDVISYVRSAYIDPPAPQGSYKADFDMEKPPWGKLGKWGEALDFIIKYFASYKIPGRFVEIGAQDGEFMSLSLWLEQKKNFEGLLVEPNPVDYKKLRARKRSAYSVQACSSPSANHMKDLLWLRDIPENLPPLLKRIQEGSNRLIKYVAVEDRELGKEVDVQCFNAGAMIYASLKTVMIDFLSISTHGGELDILASIPRKIRIRVLAIVAPIASDQEGKELKKMAEDRGLGEVHAKGNIHIFIPQQEIKTVVAKKK